MQRNQTHFLIPPPGAPPAYVWLRMDTKLNRYDYTPFRAAVWWTCQYVACHSNPQGYAPFSFAAFRAAASSCFFFLNATSSSSSPFLSFLGAYHTSLSIGSRQIWKYSTFRGLSFPPCRLDMFIRGDVKDPRHDSA